jgi:prepilin-type processing-associated H-X9-DG protein
MRKRAGLTRVDLIVAVACVFFVLANVPVIIAAGRGRAKLEVCMANLKTLTAAWQMYASDNDGKIVNGGQAPPPPGGVVTEPYWCTGTHTTADPGYDWNWSLGGSCTPGTPVLQYAERVDKLKKGAIFKYCNNVKLYRCPEAEKIMHRSYAIPNSMNAHYSGGFPEGMVVKWVGQIAKPEERIVFLEEKRITPDAFLFSYYPTNPQWWTMDRPSAMHGDGANFGFADGHADYHKWECPQTLDWIKSDYRGPAPTYAQCPKDLDWMMKAVWGYP